MKIRYVIKVVLFLIVVLLCIYNLVDKTSIVIKEDSLLKNEKKEFFLVFNYGNYGCEQCVIKVLDRLLYVKFINLDIRIKGTKLMSSLYKKFQFLPDSISIDTDTVTIPYLCLIDKEMKVINYFKYVPSEPWMFEEYLEKVNLYLQEEN